MTRLSLCTASLAAAAALVLGGCGSDVEQAASDTATSSTPTTRVPASPSSTTPSPSAAPSSPAATVPAATKPAPAAGRLIDYEATDEDGIVITSAADTSRLTGSSAAFKRFIARQLSSSASSGDEGCTEPPQIYVSRVDTGGWARGGYFVPQCGGYAALWAVADGAWTEVWGGQSLVDCATLNRYAIPSRVAGDTCDTGGDAGPYSR